MYSCCSVAASQGPDSRAFNNNNNKIIIQNLFQSAMQNFGIGLCYTDSGKKLRNRIPMLLLGFEPRSDPSCTEGHTNQAPLPFLEYSGAYLLRYRPGFTFHRILRCKKEMSPQVAPVRRGGVTRLNPTKESKVLCDSVIL